MSLISVDVEADGPCPGLGSMVCFGAVLVKDMSAIFYGETHPITENYNPEALAISGFSREEHRLFPVPEHVMEDFAKWAIRVSEGTPVFISDNPAFDWQWINYYFHTYYGSNPFGFSARRIGDLYCGLVKDSGKNWKWKKKLRKTKHTHNPVDDAMGNAEAIVAISEMMRMKL